MRNDDTFIKWWMAVMVALNIALWAGIAFVVYKVLVHFGILGG